MLGRQDLEPIQEEKEELILEPRIEAIRTKVPFFADFSKQLGREEQKHLDDDEHYLPPDLSTEPIPNDPSRPR